MAFDQDCSVNSPLRCDCVRGPCACGKRWVVNFTYTMHAEDNFCDGRQCVALDSTVSGAVEWFYDEPLPGNCVLTQIAVTGTVNVRKVSFGPCANPEFDYNITRNLADLFPSPGAAFPFIGCGDAPGLVMLRLGQLCNSVAGQCHTCCVPPDPGCGADPVLCNSYETRECSDSQSGCQRIVSGHSGCFSGSLNNRGRVFCQLACSNVGVMCDEFVNFTVTVLDPCPPDKDIDTLGGGVEAPPPTAGSLL